MRKYRLHDIRQRAILVGTLVFGILLFGGCGNDKNSLNEKKERDLLYTVMSQEEAPEELKKVIEEKQTKPFLVTFRDGSDFYLVRGYGEQKTGGYSIQVRECYLTKSTIVFGTDFIGPSKEEQVKDAASYPVIIIKLEYIDKPVIFK